MHATRGSGASLRLAPTGRPPLGGTPHNAHHPTSRPATAGCGPSQPLAPTHHGASPSLRFVTAQRDARARPPPAFLPSNLPVRRVRMTHSWRPAGQLSANVLLFFCNPLTVWHLTAAPAGPSGRAMRCATSAESGASATAPVRQGQADSADALATGLATLWSHYLSIPAAHHRVPSLICPSLHFSATTSLAPA